MAEPNHSPCSQAPWPPMESEETCVTHKIQRRDGGKAWKWVKLDRMSSTFSATAPMTLIYTWLLPAEFFNHPILFLWKIWIKAYHANHFFRISEYMDPSCSGSGQFSPTDRPTHLVTPPVHVAHGFPNVPPRPQSWWNEGQKHLKWMNRPWITWINDSYLLNSDSKCFLKALIWTFPRGPGRWPSVPRHRESTVARWGVWRPRAGGAPSASVMGISLKMQLPKFNMEPKNGVSERNLHVLHVCCTLR